MLDTIVSLITPRMKGAVALIRISGDKSLDIINSIFSKKVEESYRIYHGYVLNMEEKVDEVLVSFFKGPNSFTGEDVVEISTHGSMLIVDEILELIISKGARMASRGEFSMRAFYNGKIDLVQAEAINELINSETKAQKKLQMYSLTGETSKLIEPIKTHIADLLSLIEVNIDYPEYVDIEQMTNDRLESEVDKIIEQIDYLIKGSDKSKLLMEGIKVALVGRPNVGKSSLLNALLNEDKAIVTAIPGTTRDVVEGKTVIDGLTLNLLDTAGIRESLDEIEQIGINKSKKALDDADLVLLVLEAGNITPEDEELIKETSSKKRIIVYNKKELVDKYDEDKIYISAINKDISSLINKIKELFELKELEDLNPSFCSIREIGLLRNVKENLIMVNDLNKEETPLDIVSLPLKEAYDNLKMILGEEVTIDLEQEIFSRFCLGK